MKSLNNISSLQKTKEKSISPFSKPNFIFLIILLFLLLPVRADKVSAQEPTPDRLAEPILPENPTQYESGRYSYWLNCMPCHGDTGQGLTDEFREIWVEDHQNCWAHGCHGGGIDDEGFKIPKYVPPVIVSSEVQIKFTQSDLLFDYLLNTHPPQNPGVLPEDEYWALTAFVLAESDLLDLGRELGPSLIEEEESSNFHEPIDEPEPKEEAPIQSNTLLIVGIVLIFLVTSSVLVALINRRNTSNK